LNSFSPNVLVQTHTARPQRIFPKTSTPIRPEPNLLSNNNLIGCSFVGLQATHCPQTHAISALHVSEIPAMLLFLVSLSSFLLYLCSVDAALQLQVSCVAFGLGLCWAEATIHATSLVAALCLLMYAILAQKAQFRFSLLWVTMGLMLSHAASGLILLIANLPLMIGLVICLNVLLLLGLVARDLWRLWVTPGADTGHRGYLQDRRERRRQRLHERRECKQLWRLRKCQLRTHKDFERRSRLKSDVDWWAMRVLEISWALPQFMCHAPQAVQIPVLLTFGLARSACLHATSAWDRFNGVAKLQQSTHFRFALTAILLSTWPGRSNYKRM